MTDDDCHRNADAIQSRLEDLWPEAPSKSYQV